ncbi:MAG: peptidase T [Bacillota bacterium]|nr:peptidase T [Bacillota bacterium]
MKILERFLNYVAIDTKSDCTSDTCPSTSKQFDLANLLVDEMRDMGLENVHIDEHGYVYGTLEKNIEKDIPVVGFIAHMDTSPDFSGKDVKPKMIEDYDGEDIVLNEELGIVMKVDDFPSLKEYKGNTIITTDGTTLLGADDKAGIASILNAIQETIKENTPHGTIKIAFTPDEEIGRGADRFDVEKFAADFAYTIDGGEIGELNYENFNAASCVVTINGVNIHPGSAKNKMKNAILMAMEFNDMLPGNEIPAATEHREGFYHLNDLEGNVEKTKMNYIIRDHFIDSFEKRKVMVEDIAVFLNKKYGENTVEIKLKDSYYNMLEKFGENDMHIMDTAAEAMEMADVEPNIAPIRGGTDGSRLSYMGLLTPNVFTGGANFHGKFEFIPLESLEKSSEVVKNIIKIYAQ